MPRLASAAAISEMFSVFDSSLSKYRNVLSNCSSCAGVRFVMFRDTIWLSINATFLEMLWTTSSSSKPRSCDVKTV